MSHAQMASEFSKLADNEKIQFLCRLGTGLTVIYRVLYADKSSVPNASQKMRALNEICHKVFGQLGHSVMNAGDGYSNEAFAESLSSLAAENEIVAEFSSAWESAMASVGKKNDSLSASS